MSLHLLTDSARFSLSNCNFSVMTENVSEKVHKVTAECQVKKKKKLKTKHVQYVNIKVKIDTVLQDN